jgi:hypothetical protein
MCLLISDVSSGYDKRVFRDFHLHSLVSDSVSCYLFTIDSTPRRTVTVTRLIRISYGDYQLQTIPPGMALEIPFKPVKQQSHRGQLFKRKKEVASRDKAESTEASAVPVEWVRNV